MKITLAKVASLALLAVLSGCAVGNKYDYQLDQLPLPVSGNAAVGLNVTDERPYVLDGDKKPNFVGLQRGGFANPFNVTTLSGQPLSEDIEMSMAKGLAARGFAVSRLDLSSQDVSAIALSAEQNGVIRVIHLRILDWKSDAMIKITLHCHLRLEVYDQSGQLLASSEVSRVEAIGGAKLETQNAQSVARELERTIGELFSDPAIARALQ